jgi:uncharacterized integral membrane protein (TIGR02327 family)
MMLISKVNQPEVIYMPFLNIMAVLFFIILAWWSLQVVRFDKLVTRPNSPQAKTLQMILAVIIGYFLATFFTDYLSWFTLLRESWIQS